MQREHSAILWTFIKLPVVIKMFILSIFEWPFTQVLVYFGFKLRARPSISYSNVTLVASSDALASGWGIMIST